MRKIFTKGSILFFSMLLTVAVSCPTTLKAVANPQLSQPKLTLTVSKTYLITLKHNRNPVTWDTSNKEIVSLKKLKNNKAKLKAKRKGTAIITATSGRKKYKCKVTVKEAPKINKTNVNLKTGQTYVLQVFGTATTPKLSTSDKTVATIRKISDYKYRIYAKKVGSCYILCNVDKKILKCNVKVTAPISDTNPLSEDEVLQLYRPILLQFQEGAKENYYSWVGEGNGPLDINQYHYEHYILPQTLTYDYYTFCDLANDGLPELLIGDSNNNQIFCIYGYENNAPKLIGGDSRWRIGLTQVFISTDKQICTDFIAPGVAIGFSKDRILPNRASYFREIDEVTIMEDYMRCYRIDNNGTQIPITESAYNAAKEYTPISFQWKKISSVK